jgi:hypothetical protein
MVVIVIVLTKMGAVPYIGLQSMATVKLQQSYLSMVLKLMCATRMGRVPYIRLQRMDTVKLQQFYFSRGLM